MFMLLEVGSGPLVVKWALQALTAQWRKLVLRCYEFNEAGGWGGLRGAGAGLPGLGAHLDLVGPVSRLCKGFRVSMQWTALLIHRPARPGRPLSHAPSLLGLPVLTQAEAHRHLQGPLPSDLCDLRSWERGWGVRGAPASAARLPWE